MKTYEIYYSDGGHCGPHKTFVDAYSYAISVMRGNKVTKHVEIRPNDSVAKGGFAIANIGSFYVSRSLLN